MVKKITALFVLLVGVFLALKTPVQGAIMQNAYVSLSNPRSVASGVIHDFFFYGADDTLGSIRFYYCKAPSGNCADTGADGSLASLFYVKDDAGGDDTAFWTESWNAGEFYWQATRDDADVDADGTWEFRFTNMGNPTRTACNEDGSSTTGTCYVRLATYEDTNWTTAADTGTVSITITQAITVSARVDPTFSMTITGVVGSAQTRNGTILTNALTTTVTTIPFGNLTANTAKKAAHIITITSNNAGGYTVTAKMDQALTGTAYEDIINGFGGTGVASTVASETWTAPTGSTSGTHTGWLGVGTDDTGVGGRGTNQFFTLNTTGTIVAETDGPANARVSNIVYSIEANAYQQSDNYTGIMTYNALPTY